MEKSRGAKYHELLTLIVWTVCTLKLTTRCITKHISTQVCYTLKHVLKGLQLISMKEICKSCIYKYIYILHNDLLYILFLFLAYNVKLCSTINFFSTKATKCYYHCDSLQKQPFEIIIRCS